jgi:LuxR family maltose regulon positive regulatory protein
VFGAFLEALHGNRAYSVVLADAAAAGAADSAMPDGSPLAGWIAAMEACLCRRGVDNMRHDAETAADSLSAMNPLRGPALVLGGIAALLAGDHDGADGLLDTGGEICLRTGNIPALAASGAERALISCDRGDRAAASTLSADALRLVEDGHLGGYPEATIVFSIAARMAAGAGDVERARVLVAAASRLRPLCTAAIPWSAQFLVQLARAHLAIGDGPGARAVVRQVRDIMRASAELGVLGAQCDDLERALDTITVGCVGASALTTAELRLLPYLSTHLSYQEIGDRLYLSRNTIKTEALSIFRKLGATSRSEAVDAAGQVGLLER